MSNNTPVNLTANHYYAGETYWKFRMIEVDQSEEFYSSSSSICNWLNAILTCSNE